MRRSLSVQAWILPSVAALVILGAAAPARAHFLWLTAERAGGGVEVHAFLSEPPSPDLPEFMRHIARATYAADGRTLGAEPGEDTYVIALPDPAPRTVDGVCDLGLMTRGGDAYRLLYTARVQFGPLAADATERENGLRVRLVEDREHAPHVLVTIDGRPAAGATVKAYTSDATVEQLATNESGRLDDPRLAAEGTALLVRWADGTPGEHDGKPFTETRHYATLTLAAPVVEGTTTVTSTDATPFALLPEPINSFGAAVVGDWLYVYSGHTGTTHRYHTATTNPHFRRLDLTDRTTWEDLPCGPALQGVALVAHEGVLYRVGGMAARNAEGEPHDLVSTSEVARFDPETKVWTDMPLLPEPRSTHDAAVLGEHLYVVGGWAMPGGDSSESYFHDQAIRLDLTNPEAGWETLPEPSFRRRALAVAAAHGKIYVVGGLTEDGPTVRDVDVFDPATSTWSRGPELPGPTMQGFAPSAFGVDGRLHASGADGIVYRLATSEDAWEPVARQAVPRITHRLLPGIDKDLLLVGGNFAGVPVRFIESVPRDGRPDQPRTITWTVPVPGEAMKSQAMGLHGSRLWIVGGNRSLEPHAFQAENLVGSAYRVALDGSIAEEATPLPEPRQSGVMVVVPEGRRGTAYVLGGIGHDGEAVRTLGEVYRLDDSGNAWTRLDATIPDDRGMFGAVAHDGMIWVFGGSIWDPRPDQPRREMPKAVLRWDPSSPGGTFEPTGHELPRARRSFAGATLNGKYYLVGGLGDAMSIVEQVDVFDFATATWSTAPAPEKPRLFADLAELDGKLYMAGGFVRDESSHFAPARSIEVFDPAVGSWSTAIEELPIDSTDVRMLPVRGRLLCVGIEAGPEPQARFALIAP